MVAVELLHTARVPARTLGAARALLDDAFHDDFDDADWDHALGGLHALAWADGELVGHGAVVQRRLIHGGRALRTGHVEAVAVPSARRRNGVASAVMAALEDVVRGAYELGALGATDDGAALYTARGWQRWRGPTSVLGPAGTVRTPDADGAVLVLPGVVPLDLDGSLTCDWRDGDVW
ncbi:aminoglycoside 2'-N-acetyltransferase I [Geodermatophilus obscurus]|uniref:Aminoglycoside 2'-N-acetyltransferase I n=1 Tax=Geodermatophilus obscurus TaxID=1861 RepID=A0A1M7TRY1_9ACTN|nr:GNAT family N-acetyltransferase [Geodermatophilus obscurus]SHN73373.1 aminoglycoside 2'-N-acetyltransferase I [Geodermatophilus obscurus]